MTRRRWIADEFDANRAALTGQHAAHLARVLRARVGQEFDVAAGGVLRRARVIGVGDDRVEFELGEEVESASQLEIAMILAIFKFDRFEWAVEKCTELGATRIVPVIARRTDSHLAVAAPKRVERWRRIAHEASQQSRRVLPPSIDDPVKLKNIFHFDASERIILAETETIAKLRDLLGDDRREGSIALAVGPEGGWAEDELRLFNDAGWKSASLGSTILRAETAAVAALAVVRAIID